MAVREQPQTSLDEETLDDDALEAALELRERKKVTVGKARKAYKDADDAAKARIRQLELGEAPLRVGRLVVSLHDVAPRSVAFETNPSTRISIRLAGDE